VSDRRPCGNLHLLRFSKAISAKVGTGFASGIASNQRAGSFVRFEEKPKRSSAIAEDWKKRRQTDPPKLTNMFGGNL
jgi:hypothetical protein